MLGTRIALLRRQRGMSQKELAQRLGVSPSAVGMYEQGRREPDCAGLVRLAEIFEVSPGFLLTGNAESGCDLRALSALWQQSAAVLDGTLMLRASDGSERPFTEAELALLLAAVLSAGQVDEENCV